MQIRFRDSDMLRMCRREKKARSTSSGDSSRTSGRMICLSLILVDRFKDGLTLGSMTAYNISATGDGPSPRLGHAAILVGNAFIGISLLWKLTRSFWRRMCYHRSIP
jgi:hypothetical protein